MEKGVGPRGSQIVSSLFFLHANGNSMLAGAAVAAHVDPPVCVACGCCPRGLGRATPTYHPFRFPIGLDHYRKLPCAPPRELGVDHAWLPVTHLGGPHKGPTDSGGLWFYYARGCSDFLWDVGRTLLARNRVHLAVQLEQQHGGGDERAAVARVAEWVRRVYPKWRG